MTFQTKTKLCRADIELNSVNFILPLASFVQYRNRLEETLPQHKQILQNWHDSYLNEITTNPIQFKFKRIPNPNFLLLLLL